MDKGATVNTPTDGKQSSASSAEQHAATPAAVDPGDQDIDTAATDAYDEFASERGDHTHTPPDPQTTSEAGDAIDNDDTPIGLHDPSSMPRGEDDAAVHERSPEFHDRPGSGKYR
jgi:hypothetical protein